jgi:hypothetical protein
MTTKLILVEGLPGSGKTMTAQVIADILKEQKNGAEPALFLEGNLDHPADYESVAFLSESEFDALCAQSSEFENVLRKHSTRIGDDYFFPYRKLNSDELMVQLAPKDVYELPLEKHMAVIRDKWAAFAKKAQSEDKTYIFECAFIQNPVTAAMIKYNAPKAEVIRYVNQLATLIEPLNPVLVYVNQVDSERSFRKAIDERPKAWINSFIDYYTAQGYGLARGFSGLDGTLEVLHARKNLEFEIIDQLAIKKEIIDNSAFEHDAHKVQLAEALKGLID